MISLPTMLLPKQKYFGLSIERTVIRAVELDSHGNPLKMAEVQIPPNVISNSDIIDPQVFSDKVVELVKKGKINTPYVAVCFPEVFAYTRGHMIPVIPIEEINEAVSWQTKNLFPFPPEDLYFDWKIMQKNEKEYQLAVVAIQKVLLDQFVKALQSAGLKPLRFEPDAAALSRLLKLNIKEHALMIDIHPQGAYVTLVEGDKSLFTTAVQYNPGDLPEAFLKSIDQSLIEINSYYKDKGILDEKSTVVVVTGDLGSENWVAHLKTILPYNVQMLTTKLPNHTYNKAYAAAVSGIAPPLDELSINLMPTELQKKYDLQRSEQYVNALLLRIIIFMVFMCIFSGLTLVLTTWQKQLTDNQIKMMESQMRVRPKGVENVLQLNAQAKTITELSKSRITPKDKFASIYEMVPAGITLTLIDYDDRRMQFKLSGVSDTRESLISFKGILEKSKFFTKIDLPLGTLESSVRVPFLITFSIK
jgi:type IV pilus assembly protein PilM